MNRHSIRPRPTQRQPFGALCALLVLGPAVGSAVAREPDGTLLAREPCPRSAPNHADYRARQLATFEQEAAAARAQQLRMRSSADAAGSLLSEAEYLERHTGAAVRCERLTYASDGLRVIAYLWQPATEAAGGLRPLIIFNRGGALEDSKLRPNTQFGFHRFVTAGYVVLGTQYRGNDGGEGREQLGGADLDDVRAVVALGRALPGVDPRNVFALGYSRGAMMTLLALRAGETFNAAALVGAPTDLTTSLASADPRRLETFRSLIPDFDLDREGALRARSAMYWAERLDAPLLLLQGSADPLVSAATQTLPFAARLQQLGKQYELVVYDGDTHGLMINGRDRDARILAWFERFRRAAPRPDDARGTRP